MQENHDRGCSFPSREAPASTFRPGVVLRSVFVTHAGKVLTHTQLLRQVWGLAYEQEAHILRVNVSNLRRKLEPDPSRPRFLITEPGVGYRLRIDPPPRD